MLNIDIDSLRDVAELASVTWLFMQDVEMRKCIIYLRASTNEELQKNSFGVQRHAIEAYCRTNKLEIVGEYAEYISASKHSHRPQWEEAICELRRDPQLILVSWELTRVSRKLSDWTTLEKLLPQLRFTDMASHPPNFLEISLRLVIAQHESQKLGERISDGIARKKAEALLNGNNWEWGNAHRISKEKQAIGRTANINKAHQHALIVEQALQGRMGQTLVKRVEYLNNETTIRTRRGAKWTTANLHRVLNR